MEVRSYYAITVEAAMMLAMRELGPDALLIQSSRSAPDSAHLGRYKVLVSGELQSPQAVSASVRKNLPLPVTELPANTAIDVRRPALHHFDPAELTTLGPIDLLRGKLIQPAAKPDFAALLKHAEAAYAPPAPVENLHIENFDTEPALPEPPREETGVVKSARRRTRKKIKPPVIACNPGLGRPYDPSPTVAFLGPTGSGKTTTIMKLALVYGLLASRNVRLVAIDPDRLGATVRLRAFADLLNMPFAECETSDELSRVLKHPFAGLTLVDTAGYTRSETSLHSRISQWLRPNSHIETQLVLRADRKTADNRFALESVYDLHPDRLILTALDETENNEELFELIHRSAIPVSFICAGPRIPEDILPALSERFSSANAINGF